MFKRNYTPYTKTQRNKVATPSKTNAPKTGAFANAVINEYNDRMIRTENGMRSRATSASAVLDFFSKVGSARGVDLSKDFIAAYVENSDLTIRALLWARDITEGAGERSQFRKLINTLEKSDPQAARAIMHKIPELGRWDDLFAYTDYNNRQTAFGFIRDALEHGNGLCAKWMPRKGPVAVELTKFLGYTPKQYRKLLVRLSNTVEQKMCAKEWEKINFSHVPSVASARYQKAFGRNAPVQYSEYKAELKKPQAERDPKVKINAKAVYPYDVVKSVVRGDAAVADEQWKALPDYLNGTRTLPLVDVSGSMGAIHYSRNSSVQPIDIAVSLGLYLADRTSSPFKDLFLTFSETSEFVRVSGTLSQKIAQMSSANWGFNTNLHAAFDNILNLAIRNRVPADEMPEVLLILSDMQFDQCATWDDSATQMIERKYAMSGYTMPKIVFWNLREGYGKKDTPVRFDQRGVCQVSGFSPAIMKSVLANDLENFTPYNVMLKTLMKSRYDH